MAEKTMTEIHNLAERAHLAGEVSRRLSVMGADGEIYPPRLLSKSKHAPRQKVDVNEVLRKTCQRSSCLQPCAEREGISETTVTEA